MLVQRKSENYVFFRDLKSGDVFHSSDTYMKIQEVNDCDQPDIIRNAIRLYDGCSWRFEDEIEVVKIEGKFVEN